MCYAIDNKRRYQTLRKIRDTYLKLPAQIKLKMKVSVAAKTMSNTVATLINVWWFA